MVARNRTWKRVRHFLLREKQLGNAVRVRAGRMAWGLRIRPGQINSSFAWGFLLFPIGHGSKLNHQGTRF